MSSEGSKVLFRSRTFVLSVLLGISVLGCDLFGPSVERYLIRVDSIVAPVVVSPDDTLRVRFQGEVGPNGCYRLVRVAREVTTSSLEVIFHGEHRVDSGHDCTQAIVTMDHEETVEPPLAGPFKITVHQPDGSFRERVVTVE